VAPRSRLRKQPETEPIPGYRLIEPIGSGGFGEVWKCEAPGGLLKAIKFVYGGLSALEGANAAAEDELKAIQRVKVIRHPFLLSMERVEYIAGELVIVLELADQSLHDLLTEQRDAGRDGIRRDELLGYLRETAEALDLMNIQHGLQHLDIKPRNLFLVCNHVKVGDFGLVNGMRLGDAGQAPALELGGITPLYASPELFRGTISQSSDQYSLALVYHELLTGLLPFDGTNARQLLFQHLTVEPDLSMLPAADRAAIARALAKEPGERFPSCGDLVRALQDGGTTASARGPKAAPGKVHHRGAQGPGSAPTKSQEKARGTGEASQQTVTLTAAGTDTHPNRPRASSKGETLAGHQLLRCLHNSPLWEVWNAKTPAGAPRLVKCIFGIIPHNECDAAEALATFRALQNPTLLPTEVLQSTPGRLVLATEPSETSLRDLFQEYVAQGKPGIPRDELLGYLESVAGALSDLNRVHGIQHLGLNPRNLVFIDDQMFIADFGLAQLFWLPAGQALGRLNARHAAPELLQNQVGAGSDQYSLASIYHEMLTGVALPRPASLHEGADILALLERLPACDREIVACALDPRPHRRWPSCADFVRALRAAAREHREKTASPPSVDSSPDHGADDGLQIKLHVPLPLGIIRRRLEAFRAQWNGDVIHDDENIFVFQMKSPRSLWQRWLGRSPGLEAHVRLSYAGSTPPAGAEIAIEIKSHDCGRKQSDELLKVIGPLVLESARSFLQVNPKRRANERFVWRHTMHACPILEDGTVGEALECRGKDISLNGIGFYLPRPLGTTQARLHLPHTPQTPAMSVPVRIVRMRECAEGGFEAGAILLSSEFPAPASEPEA
jgi:serine/threonine protein kinase